MVPANAPVPAKYLHLRIHSPNSRRSLLSSDSSRVASYAIGCKLKTEEYVKPLIYASLYLNSEIQNKILSLTYVENNTK